MQLCRCKFVQNMSHVLYLYAVSYTGDGITQITWITSVLEIYCGDHKPSISEIWEMIHSLSLNYLSFFFAWKSYYFTSIFKKILLLATECWKVKVTQSCPTPCDPMDYTVHGILQARKLEWVAVPFLRGSSQPRDQTQASHIAGRFFTSWATGETQTFHLSKFGRWYMAFNKLSQLFYLPGKVFICLECWVDRVFLPSFFSFLPLFHCLLIRLL